jgi:hypothetical protein
MDHLGLSTPSLLEWHSVQLCHLAHGGVIDNSWTFASNQLSLLPSTKPDAGAYIPRRLCHIIDKTRRVAFCRAVPQPSRGRHEAQYLDWQGVLPKEGMEEALILCPLVYSPTGWVIRRLSVGELMAACDVSETLLPVIPDSALHPTLLPFLNSAPSRLLCRVLDTMIKQVHLENHPAKPQLTPKWPGSPGLTWLGTSAPTTRADDAEAPKAVWNMRVLQIPHSTDLYNSFEQRFAIDPLDCLRHLLLCIWRRRVLSSLCQYLVKEYGEKWASSSQAVRDREVGRDCLYRASHASWWEWCLGSTPFFWRWPLATRRLVRDGHPPWFLSDPPRFMQPQRRESDVGMAKNITEKLENVAQKGYIQPGQVLSLTKYFAVPKGDQDIRMVYDATISGLNDALWVPTFTLPGTDELVERMDQDSWMGDLDMGEQFLNFPLHPSLQCYCGIDVRPYLSEKRNKTMWWRWARCMMGLKSSPYFAVQGTYFAEEVAQGDLGDPENPFHWASVRMNLPGSPAYQPNLPWVSRLTCSGKLAGGHERYVDDIRTVGRSMEHSWQLGHRLATTFAYLGLQIALRKFRPPTQHPGPWAGTIAFSTPLGVGVTCAADKWDKAQTLIAQLSDELHQDVLLDRKTLESTRGFLTHLARTFPVITVFLKGFHLTLDGWRGNREADLWKLPRDEWEDTAPTDAPPLVAAAPRLVDDVYCLTQLFSSTVAPIRPIRCVHQRVAIYGFVDASTSGHGSSFALPNGALLFRHGVWGRDTDDLSSNFRELCNLVESVEEAVLLGELDGCELFIFTDNTTAEGGYYRGNSDNRVLFSLFLRLRLLEMQYSLKLHLIHVAGTRMIQQGTDGLSRGLHTDGVFAQQPMLWHIPLHLSALDRCPLLLTWIRTWSPCPHISPLQPEEWFTTGHGQNSPPTWFLWAPAPAAARHALMELATARHKRPYHQHLFICPRLFTSRWRKMLYKIADVVIDIPPGTWFWPSNMHEPLILGLVLRFSSVFPWLSRGQPRILELVRALRAVWTSVPGSERAILCELCTFPESLEALS